MDLQQMAIYGGAPAAYQNLTASMVNPTMANGETDWSAILANGIRGAAQGAIAAKVNEAYASGQLVHPAAQRPANSGLMGLLIVGAILYAVSQ